MNNSDQKQILKCLLIKTNNVVEIVDFNIKEDNIKKYLNCENSKHIILDYVDKYGYKCGIICKDKTIDDDKVNKMASLICVEQRNKGKSIYGDVLLVDDFKDLTKEDLSTIMRHAFNYDYQNDDGTMTMETSDDLIHKSQDGKLMYVGDKYKKKWIQLPKELGGKKCNVLATCNTKCDCEKHFTTLYVLEGKYMTMQCTKANGFLWMYKPENKTVSQIVKEQSC
jgi:hypothetical protein